MEINRNICPPGLGNNPNRPLKAIEYITIHCTGNYNPGADAKNHASYQYGGSSGAQASWHYTADKDSIWQSFEDNSETWHAGDGNNGPGNYTSIAIEICVNDKAGFSAACDNAAKLTAELLKKHNLTVDKVVQHNKWSGKNCPQELINGKWGITWEDFISMVKEHTKTPAPSTLYYRVQLGAFLNKANAEALLQRVRDAGFAEAFICYM